MAESEQSSDMVWTCSEENALREGEREWEDQLGSVAVTQVRGDGTWTKMLAVGVGTRGRKDSGVGGESDRAGEVEEGGALVSGLAQCVDVGGGAVAEMGNTGGGAGCFWEQM